MKWNRSTGVIDRLILYPGKAMTVSITHDYILKAKILPVLLMLSVTIHPTDVSAGLVAYLDVSKTDKGGQHNQATHSTLFGESSFRRLYTNIWFGNVMLKKDLVWKVLCPAIWLTE